MDEHDQVSVREPVCNPSDNLEALRQTMGDARIPTIVTKQSNARFAQLC